MMAPLVCAVYTRKSSDEGLEQEYNSLDAQREACAAYVLSQKSMGWVLSSHRYDDGGYSGGTTKRPALERLISDIQAGHVQVVVVYKVDRLTRSLSDFSRLIDLFDANGTSFVSVTQQFNTNSSMGRLTLNVLLSFAQYEREITGERIRDKFAASKKRGMWMGGNPPLGYLAVDKKLLIDEKDAARVRTIFELYLRYGSVTELKKEIDKRGWLTATRKTQKGTQVGGRPFSRGHLRLILENRIYRGEIPHKGIFHAGEHDPVIDEVLWSAVQHKLEQMLTRHHTRRDSVHPIFLAGLIFDSADRRVGTSHGKKDKRRYAYYVVKNFRSPVGRATKNLSFRVDHLDRPVIDALIYFFKFDASVTSNLEADAIIQMLTSDFMSERIKAMRMVLVRAKLNVDHLELHVRRSLGSEAQEHLTAFCIRFDLLRFQRNLCFVQYKNEPLMNLKPKVGDLIAKSHDWLIAFTSGRYDSISSFAADKGVSSGYVLKMIYLGCMAPDLAMHFLGESRSEILEEAELLSKLPLPESWVEQRKLFRM